MRKRATFHKGKSPIFAGAMKQRTYIAIDLKSFYASVECVERGLDPLTTNLVVADKSRTDKTICLADEDSEILNQKMAYLREVISKHPAIVVTYFEPDKKKAGGAYKTIEGQLQNIDDYSQCLVMKDGKVVFIRSVLDISVSGY